MSDSDNHYREKSQGDSSSSRKKKFNKKKPPPSRVRHRESRIDEKRKREGKKTLDKLEEDLKKRLHVGLTNEEVLPQIHETEAKRSVMHSVTTRRIGLGVNMFYLTASNYPNIVFNATCYQTYRVI